LKADFFASRLNNFLKLSFKAKLKPGSDCFFRRLILLQFENR